ncbi:BA75_01935T0 [Komagataella pastoris]|uniref:BA75_01935T0 n=1 Tax=Komagataella pastoris TaxID=4922 RepID=A0A1B2JD56_PICPA|nr:BA75_01935T0 [Komagataella pastoris]
MYPVFIIKGEIPEINKFYCPELEANTYYNMYFIIVENEEEIKLHLCNIETISDPSYFVIKENKEIFFKAKSLSFNSEYKLDEFYCAEMIVSDIAIGNTSPEEVMYETDVYKKIRIYNQKYENKINLDYTEYNQAENEKSAYMEELNKDHFNDGTFIYIENNKTYLKCINKTIDWKLEVVWSKELLNLMVDTYIFKETKYKSFLV